MTDWFRSWHGAPTDPKWLVVAKKAGTIPAIVSAVVWALFDHASQEEDRGDVGDFDVETYAAMSGLDEELVRKIIGALTDKGIIADYRLTSWEKRQPQREDGSAERSKAWRERKQTQATAEKRPEERREDTDKIREEKIGAASAPDARTTLFAQGIQELSALSGRPAGKLRSIVGKWLRDCDDDALRVLTLISKAKRDRPADPVPWIERHLRPNGTGPPGSGAYAAKPPSGSQEMVNAFKQRSNGSSAPPPISSEPDRGFVETLGPGEFRRTG